MAEPDVKFTFEADLSSFAAQMDKLVKDGRASVGVFEKLVDPIGKAEGGLKSLLDEQTKVMASLRMAGKEGTAEYAKIAAEAKKAAGATKDYEGALTDVRKELGLVEDEANSAGRIMTAVFAAEAIGQFGDMLGSISERFSGINQSLRDMQALTGANAAEMKVLEGEAMELMNSGGAESLEEANNLITQIRRQYKGIVDDDQLGEFTKGIVAQSKIQQIEATDLASKLRGVYAEREQQGRSWLETQGLLTQGMKADTSASQDYVDIVSEYSQLWDQNGRSLESFNAEVMAVGTSSVFTLDKLEDLHKEAGAITVDAMENLPKLEGVINQSVLNSVIKQNDLVRKGLITNEEYVKQTAKIVNEGLEKGLLTQAEAQDLLVTTFGTPVEDLGLEATLKIATVDVDHDAIRKQAESEGEALSDSIIPPNVFERMTNRIEAWAAKGASVIAPVTGALAGVATTAGQIAPALTVGAEAFGKMKAGEGILGKLGATLGSAKGGGLIGKLASFGPIAAISGKVGAIGMGALLLPLIKIVAVAGAVVVAFKLMWDNSKVFRDAITGIGEKLSGLWEKVKTGAAEMWAKVKPVLAAVGKFLGNVLGTAISVLGNVIGWLAGKIGDLVGFVINFHVNVIKTAAAVVKWIADFTGLTAAIGWVIDAVKDVVQWVQNFIANIQNAESSIRQKLQPALDWLSDAVQAVAGFFEDLAEILADVVVDAVEAVSAAFEWLMDNVLSPIGSFISNVFIAIWDGLKWAMDQVWGAIQRGIGFFKNLWDLVKQGWSFLESLGGWFTWLTGPINSVIGVVGKVIDALKNAYSWVSDLLSKAGEEPVINTDDADTGGGGTDLMKLAAYLEKQIQKRDTRAALEKVVNRATELIAAAQQQENAEAAAALQRVLDAARQKLQTLPGEDTGGAGTGGGGDDEVVATARKRSLDLTKEQEKLEEERRQVLAKAQQETAEGQVKQLALEYKERMRVERKAHDDRVAEWNRQAAEVQAAGGDVTGLAEAIEASKALMLANFGEYEREYTEAVEEFIAKLPKADTFDVRLPVDIELVPTEIALDVGRSFDEIIDAGRAFIGGFSQAMDTGWGDLNERLKGMLSEQTETQKEESKKRVAEIEDEIAAIEKAAAAGEITMSDMFNRLADLSTQRTELLKGALEQEIGFFEKLADNALAAFAAVGEHFAATMDTALGKTGEGFSKAVADRQTLDGIESQIEATERLGAAGVLSASETAEQLGELREEQKKLAAEARDSMSAALGSLGPVAEAAAGQMLSVFANMAATGKATIGDFADAALLTTLNAIEGVITANIAAIFTTAAGLLGPIAGPIVAAAVIGTGLGLLNVAKADIQGRIGKKFAEGVVDLDGPGTETSDSILAWLSRRESVATAKATTAPGNADALRYGNRHGKSYAHYYLDTMRGPNLSGIHVGADGKLHVSRTPAPTVIAVGDDTATHEQTTRLERVMNLQGRELVRQSNALRSIDRKLTPKRGGYQKSADTILRERVGRS